MGESGDIGQVMGARYRSSCLGQGGRWHVGIHDAVSSSYYLIMLVAANETVRKVNTPPRYTCARAWTCCFRPYRAQHHDARYRGVTTVKTKGERERNVRKSERDKEGKEQIERNRGSEGDAAKRQEAGEREGRRIHASKS